MKEHMHKTMLTVWSTYVLNISVYNVFHCFFLPLFNTTLSSVDRLLSKVKIIYMHVRFKTVTFGNFSLKTKHRMAVENLESCACCGNYIRPDLMKCECLNRPSIRAQTTWVVAIGTVAAGFPVVGVFVDMFTTTGNAQRNVVTTRRLVWPRSYS